MRNRLKIMAFLLLATTWTTANEALSPQFISYNLQHIIETDDLLRANFKGGEIVDLKIEGQTVEIYLSSALLAGPENIEAQELLSQQIINMLSELNPKLRNFKFLYEASENKFYAWRQIYGTQASLIQPPPVYTEPPVMLPLAPGGGGALNNKRIIVVPNRGSRYDGGWKYRVDAINNIIPDLVVSQITTHHLIPLLEGAGAYVFTSRERDFNVEEFIIDNTDSGFTATGTWADGNSPGGYKGTVTPWYKTVQTSATETATASYMPAFSKPGWYDVHTWFVEGSNRATNVKYKIVHAAGSDEVLVDQTQNGSRWLHLGRYYFSANGQGVIISNASDQAGKYVIADAARFGGGMGSIEESGVKSGLPRWHEGPRYWTWFLGAPSSVYNSQATASSSDLYARPLYANWQGGDSFVTITTNSFGDTNVTGTETYCHDSEEPTGSLGLRDAIQDRLIEFIQREYKADWNNRGGKKTTGFNELNEIQGMPAATAYIGFHSNPDVDALAMRSPKFRRAVGKGIAQGIIKYFNASADELPGTPVSVRARVTAGGIEVNWKATTGATKYVVYYGKNNRGFGNLAEVAGTSHTIANPTEGTTYFIAVAAKNNTGLSYKSKTIAARKAAGTQAGKLLIVDAYDRQDIRIDELSNTGDYSVEHALAAPAEWEIAGATSEAVAEALVALADYTVVDVILGQESTVDETFSKDEQTIYKTYLDAGGKLFVSGSEIAYDLDDKGDATDKAFYENYLKATFVADDCGGCYKVTAVAGTYFASLGEINFSNGANGVYDVPYPDQIFAAGGSVEVLQYPSGNGAMVAYHSATTKVVNFGVPFEAVIPASKRAELMAKILDFFTVYDPNAPEDAGTTDTGVEDAGVEDTGPEDTGVEDAGPEDTGVSDTGPEDTGAEDTGVEDTGVADTGSEDASPTDTGPEDTGAPEDTGTEDVPEEDTGGEEDSGEDDAGGDDDAGEEDVGDDDDAAPSDDDDDDNATGNDDDSDETDAGSGGGEDKDAGESGEEDAGSDDDSWWPWDDDDEGDGIPIGDDDGRAPVEGDEAGAKEEGGCGCRIR